jgi:hypothetical protein
MSFPCDFLFNCYAPIDPIAILSRPTRRLLQIVAQIFYPVLFYIRTIVQSLFLCSLLVCHHNRLPAILTNGQYLANELNKNLVLIINGSLPVRHAYGGGKKTSQGKRAEYRTKREVLRNLHSHPAAAKRVVSGQEVVSSTGMDQKTVIKLA